MRLGMITYETVSLRDGNLRSVVTLELRAGYRTGNWRGYVVNRRGDILTISSGYCMYTQPGKKIAARQLNAAREIEARREAEERGK